MAGETKGPEGRAGHHHMTIIEFLQRQTREKLRNLCRDLELLVGRNKQECIVYLAGNTEKWVKIPPRPEPYQSQRTAETIVIL